MRIVEEQFSSCTSTNLMKPVYVLDHTARKYAADDVKLFYNDYGTIGKTKRQYIYNLCKSLKEKNLIDGIGLQDGFSLNINDTNTSRLYDKDFNPKPVYYSIQDAFMLYY